MDCSNMQSLSYYLQFHKKCNISNSGEQGPGLQCLLGVKEALS